MIHVEIEINCLRFCLCSHEWVRLGVNLSKFQNFYSPGCTRVNLMYICASLFTLVHLHGCSRNCKPILARNNLEITDKHSLSSKEIPS